MKDMQTKSSTCTERYCSSLKTYTQDTHNDTEKTHKNWFTIFSCQIIQLDQISPSWKTVKSIFFVICRCRLPNAFRRDSSIAFVSLYSNEKMSCCFAACVCSWKSRIGNQLKTRNEVEAASEDRNSQNLYSSRFFFWSIARVHISPIQQFNFIGFISYRLQREIVLKPLCDDLIN